LVCGGRLLLLLLRLLVLVPGGPEPLL